MNRFPKKYEKLYPKNTTKLSPSFRLYDSSKSKRFLKTIFSKKYLNPTFFKKRLINHRRLLYDNLNNLTLSHRKYTPRTRVLNHELRPLKVKIFKKNFTGSLSEKKNTILNSSTKYLKVKPSTKETIVYTKLKRSLNSFYRTKKSILSDLDRSKKNKTLLNKKINLEKKINLLKKTLPFFTKTKALKKVVFSKKDTKVLNNFEKIYCQNRGGTFDMIKSNNNFKNFFLKNLKINKSSESIQKKTSLNKMLRRFSKYSHTLEKTYEPSMKKNQLDPITSLKNLIIDKKIKTKQSNSL